jgi:TldD protein
MSSGISSRVYQNGYWGFDSLPKIEAGSVDTILKGAAFNARFLAGKSKTAGPVLPEASGSKVLDIQPGRVITITEKQEFVSELYERVSKRYDHLKSVLVVLNELQMEKQLITSQGSHSYYLMPKSHVIVRLISEDKEGKPVEIYQIFGGKGYFGDHFNDITTMDSTLDQLHQHLMAKRSAVGAKGGDAEVVLYNEITGILAHEAIGHTTEADIVLAGSIAGEELNQEIGSSLVNMVDFAHTYNGKQVEMPLFMDDEGMPAEDAVLIEEGILKGYMHNRETSARLGMKPTGNARAYAFDDEPLVRMRNTAILPGSSSLEEMIASIDDGYYLLKTGNGQADSTSEFMFGITMGYEIKQGKIGQAIKDTSISGVAFDMLKTIDMVGNDMHWKNAGMCGKKQPMPVSMGGPSLRCRIHMGGE